MRPTEPIVTAHLFAPLHAELVALLRGLTAEEWLAPTAAGTWRVKDVAAHLLDTAMRRLSMQRDGYFPPPPDGELAPFLHRLNAEWVAVTDRVSPRILVELLERYGGELGDYVVSFDPHAEAQWAVSWAGEERSANWFDTARELTERWHHQQQIRDAVGRPPLYERYLAPVLDTFVRALPFTYRDVSAPEGSSVVLRIVGEGEGEWTLVRDESSWRLYAGAASSPTTTVTMRGDTAWRLFTKQKVDGVQLDGNRSLGEPILRMTSVV